MNERQKNKSMVNAFGTGKPPVATVRRLGESRQQQRVRKQGVDSNSDINAIFSGMQQMRTRVHKGMSGMPLNPDGTDPGNSFDAFMRKNPHLQGASQRQAQYDQQARGNAASAVAERKALQGMQNPNLVTGADGYRTLFDPQGKVIGTTKPIKSSATWSKNNAINKGTATAEEHGDFAQTLQDTGMSSVASEIQGPKLPASMSTLFPGKSSPPGGGQGDRVGSSNPSGEPGGETSMGQMPNVQGNGMPEDYNRTLGYGPNAGPQADWNALLGYGANQGPQVNWNRDLGYGPNAGPNESMRPNEGPQLQYGKPEQLQALSKVQGFAGGGFGRTAPTPVAAVNLGLSNMFPGVKDWEYLQGLFPGLVSPQNGGMQNTKNILDLLNNPAYLSQLNR